MFWENEKTELHLSLNEISLDEIKVNVSLLSLCQIMFSCNELT